MPFALGYGFGARGKQAIAAYDVNFTILQSTDVKNA
jgi:hypothetical protein